ncbi:NLR family CARD domain-containing protein 3-like [Dermacentor albipictus]|uniref:NLR family CARD domain-containing protein 3-like n=1 Tax=Dermacentor albipictus TaxID=60249 RepID=UPI0038FD116F
MEPAPTGVGGMESAIKSLDSERLLHRVGSLLGKLKSRGVDLQAPCSDTLGKTKCWLKRHLPAVNEVLWKISMQVVEHVPGAFTLGSLDAADVDTVRTDASFQDGGLLVYWLLAHHSCIKRLLLGVTAVPLWHFPSLLASAIHASRGIVEVAGDPNDMTESWREIRQCRVLACALGKLSPALNCLDLTSLKLDHVAAECIADDIARSNLRRLHLCSEMSASVTRKLLSGVSSCQSLTSLELTGFTQFSRSSAVALAAALKRNRTLRRLFLKFVEDDVVGIILACLKHNEGLHELSLDYSIDFTRSTMWDGLQALRENRVLKCLKLTDAYLSNSCAMVIAEVLRHNNALEEVSLSTNQISDLGARALAKTLEQSSSIRRLDISQNRLTAGVVPKFIEAISRNSTIECVELGNVDIPEEWAPTSPLTADVFARLHVSWNGRGLEEWAACLPCEGHRFSRPSIGWNNAANCSGIVQWFSAARASSASLVELVIECPRAVGADCTEAVVSFLETTHSLKKLIVRPSHCNYVFSAAVINGLARNKTVCEAEFHQELRAHLDVKAIEALLLANRTLHRLKFRDDSLPSKAPTLFARALEDNFVFLTLEFERHYVRNDMYPIVSALNRNRSLLNRAVECVLGAARDELSARALRLLSATESLLDTVADVSGKTREECRCLVLEAVRRLNSQASEDVVTSRLHKVDEDCGRPTAPVCVNSHCV